MCFAVALRKESVDRNCSFGISGVDTVVALRKESVDRNCYPARCVGLLSVALRKESVDRNHAVQIVIIVVHASLSARRAWIEMREVKAGILLDLTSLSARRAWIEIY